MLVIDFEEDPDGTGGLNDADAEAMFDGRARRYFAIALLESRQAYMHEVGTSDTGCTSVEVARHHAILPNPSQKVASFAVIEAGSLSVSFCDKSRNIAGADRMLIPDGLLQCSTRRLDERGAELREPHRRGSGRKSTARTPRSRSPRPRPT